MQRQRPEDERQRMQPQTGGPQAGAPMQRSAGPGGQAGNAPAALAAVAMLEGGGQRS